VTKYSDQLYELTTGQRPFLGNSDFEVMEAIVTCQPEARAYRRTETLLHRALAYVGLGEFDKAVTAVELALEEEPRTDDVHEVLQRHVGTIVTVYESMLEDPYRIPVLVRPMHELIPVEFEPRARLLLPWIDGETTIKDLIVRSGMQRLDAYHHLCQFLLRGIIR
jgi:hypothetical protein